MNQYQQPYQPAPAQDLTSYVAQLEARVRQLEARLPNTSLVASGFMKRAFAAWGHVFVANFIIGLVMSVIGVVISLIFGVGMLSLIDSAGGF